MRFNSGGGRSGGCGDVRRKKNDGDKHSKQLASQRIPESGNLNAMNYRLFCWDSAAINLGPTHAREDLHVTISCKHSNIQLNHSILFYGVLYYITHSQSFFIFGLPQIHVTCFPIGTNTPT